MSAPKQFTAKRSLLTGIRGKLIFALLLTAVPMVALVGYFGMASTSTLLHDQAIRNMRDLAALQAKSFEEIAKLGSADVLYRAKSPHVLRFARACATPEGPPDDLIRSTHAEFVALAESHEVYAQVRYIDIDGMERARVNYAGGIATVVAVDELQDKSDRDYFERALELGAGLVHVSPLDLNRENLEIERPLRPVIRFATAVQGEAGLLGIVVLNVDGRPLLPNVAYEQGATYVVDPEGWFLSHTDTSLAWSGPRNLDTSHNLHARLGELTGVVLQPVEQVLPGNGKIVATKPVLLGVPFASNYLVVCVERDEAAIAAEMLDFRRFFWAIMAISFAAPVLAGLALASFFLRPVKSLRQAVHSVAEGDLTSTAKVNSGDEFQDLADDFNTMANRLQEYRRNERAALVGRMARTIIHDIKNPLSSITVFAKLLGKPDLPDADRSEAAERTQSQVDRILAMLQEILEFSRGEGGRLELEQTTFDELLADLRPGLEAQCEDKNVELVMSSSVECALSVDRHQLQRALSNITTNACEAMDDGGTLSVLATCDDEAVVIEILDTGPGLPDQILGQLMEPFVTHGKTNGTGLGLAIAKAIIIGFSDRLTAENRPGGGARFAAWLPLDPPDSTDDTKHAV